jgi:hypothetical protein
VNVLDDVFVLAIEFRQLFDDDAAELELPATGRLLRMLAGDTERRDCGCTWASPLPRVGISASEEGDNGRVGDCDFETEVASNAIIRFDTFVARAEPELEPEPRESDRVLMVASLLPFPNDSFHLLGFFVTVATGIDTGTGTGGGGGTSGKD